MRAIGVDLGTTTARCAIRHEGGFVVISIPSCVSFDEEGRPSAGEAAIDRANAVRGVKRFLGRKFSDPDVRKHVERASFEVRSDEEGGCAIFVDQRRFSPEEICGAVVRELKAAAEDFIGEPVTDAVISVPAHFGYAQKRAATAAGSLAGLKVLRVVSDTASALLAAGCDDDVVASIDCGGGELSVSRADGTGDGGARLGGDDFDDLLVDHFSREFLNKRGIPVSAESRLRSACEGAKRDLSRALQTTVDVEDLGGGYDFHSSITRARFEEICADLFRRFAEKTAECLGEGTVLLSGGTTRIPKIRQMFGAAIDSRDDAVAVGAAIRAETLCKGPLDVTPLSLGLETYGGLMHVVFPRGTRLPVRRELPFSTFADGQPGVLLQIFEGERPVAKDNSLIGELDIPSGFSTQKRGEPEIMVVFEVDADGVLTVSAADGSCGTRVDIDRLSDVEIAEKVADAESCRDRDSEEARKATERVELNEYAYRIKRCGLGTEAARAANEALVNMDSNPEIDAAEIRHALKAQIEELILTRNWN